MRKIYTRLLLNLIDKNIQKFCFRANLFNVITYYVIQIFLFLCIYVFIDKITIKKCMLFCHLQMSLAIRIFPFLLLQIDSAEV